MRSNLDNVTFDNNLMDDAYQTPAVIIVDQPGESGYIVVTGNGSTWISNGLPDICVWQYKADKGMICSGVLQILSTAAKIQERIQAKKTFLPAETYVLSSKKL